MLKEQLMKMSKKELKARLVTVGKEAQDKSGEELTALMDEAKLIGEILDEIKKTWHEKPGEDAGEQKFLADIIRVPVLVIDDIGVEKPTEWVNEKFYSILNGRMIQKQVTIFTSNCEMENLLFDDRIVNRIMKMALPVPFPDESVRASLAKAENKELYNRLLRG